MSSSPCCATSSAARARGRRPRTTGPSAVHACGIARGHGGRRRWIFNWMHWTCGRALLPLSFLQLALGLSFIKLPHGMPTRPLTWHTHTPPHPPHHVACRRLGAVLHQRCGRRLSHCRWRVAQVEGGRNHCSAWPRRHTCAAAAVPDAGARGGGAGGRAGGMHLGAGLGHRHSHGPHAAAWPLTRCTAVAWLSHRIHNKARISHPHHRRHHLHHRLFPPCPRRRRLRPWLNTVHALCCGVTHRLRRPPRPPQPRPRPHCHHRCHHRRPRVPHCLAQP